MVEVLRAILADIPGAAALYGKKVRKCSFCHRKLTTKASRTVGYGPKCAKDRDLPWGYEGDDDDEEE